MTKNHLSFIEISDLSAMTETSSSNLRIESTKLKTQVSKPTKHNHGEENDFTDCNNELFKLNSTMKENNKENCVGSIKVTIRDKPILESKEINEEIMKWAFHCLFEHMKETKRLCELKIKVQEKLRRLLLQRYFKMWRARMNNNKTLAEERKDNEQFCNEKKIESFMNSIVKKQEKTNKTEKNEHFSKKQTSSNQLPAKTVHIIDPFLQNRLNMQKKIINEQRLKLVEQNRIIEDMKLKQIEKELQNGEKETMNSAEKVLRKCGKRTRSTLMKLMREDNETVDSPRPPDPPRFLLRMEARAERRRERVAQAREERRRKAEEQRRREEILRKAEEERQKRLQLEIQRNAKRIHEEQEKKRLQEIERIRAANELANSYCKRYLLRNYIMNPLVRLIEEKYNHMQIAADHYAATMLRRAFGAWRKEMEKEVAVKTDLCTSLYNNNILWRSFFVWIDRTREELKRCEAATAFYNGRLQRRCLKIWYNEMLESRLRSLKNEQIAADYCIARVRAKYLRRWIKYIEISEEVKDSDKRKEKWRQLIQNVIPDFSPKCRGVLSD